MGFISKGFLNKLIVNTVILAANKIAANMGNKGGGAATSSLITKYTNDFELVIRASKELESILTTHCYATGKGLHEYTSRLVVLYNIT